jgi:hypothetical protein
MDTGGEFMSHLNIIAFFPMLMGVKIIIKKGTRMFRKSKDSMPKVVSFMYGATFGLWLDNVLKSLHLEPHQSKPQKPQKYISINSINRIDGVQQLESSQAILQALKQHDAVDFRAVLTDTHTPGLPPVPVAFKGRLNQSIQSETEKTDFTQFIVTLSCYANKEVKTAGDLAECITHNKSM